GLNRRGHKHGIRPASLGDRRNFAEQSLDGRIARIKGNLVTWKGLTRIRVWRTISKCSGLHGAVRTGALIAEVPRPFLYRRHRLVEVLARHPLSAPFLRPEEERVILPDWPANGVTVVILFVRRNVRQEVVARVKGVVAHELVRIAVEAVGTRLSLHL